MIRIGLLGAAWITPMAILNPTKLLPNVKVVAVAARDPERAKEYAKEHGISETENSYDELLARPDLDLVYIALPVSLHAKWAERALTAGNNVLCEKPLVMNVQQAKELSQISSETGKFLIEAFHYMHHPYFKRIQEIVKTGELGKIRQLTGRLHVPVPPRDGQIRHDPSMGGGALMDLGCYPLHMMRTLTGDEPSVVTADAIIGPSGVDLSIKAALEFNNGIRGFIDCAMPEEGELQGELIIEGETGTLHASKPILPHLGGVLQIDSGQGRRLESSNTQSTFYYQLLAIDDAIHGRTHPLPSMRDSIGNAIALDSIRSAFELGKPF